VIALTILCPYFVSASPEMILATEEDNY